MEHYFVETLPKSCFFCDCCHTKDFNNRYKIDGDSLTVELNRQLKEDI